MFTLMFTRSPNPLSSCFLGSSICAASFSWRACIALVSARAASAAVGVTNSRAQPQIARGILRLSGLPVSLYINEGPSEIALSNNEKIKVFTIFLKIYNFRKELS